MTGLEFVANDIKKMESIYGRDYLLYDKERIQADSDNGSRGGLAAMFMGDSSIEDAEKSLNIPPGSVKQILTGFGWLRYRVVINFREKEIDFSDPKYALALIILMPHYEILKFVTSDDFITVKNALVPLEPSVIRGHNGFFDSSNLPLSKGAYRFADEYSDRELISYLTNNETLSAICAMHELDRDRVLSLLERVKSKNYNMGTYLNKNTKEEKFVWLCKMGSGSILWSIMNRDENYEMIHDFFPERF